MLRRRTTEPRARRAVPAVLALLLAFGTIAGVMQGQALGHNPINYGTFRYTFTGALCTANYGAIHHTSGSNQAIVYHSNRGPCRDLFGQPAGHILSSFQIWLNGDGHGGGIMCYNSGWRYNSHGAAAADAFHAMNWGACANGRATIDLWGLLYWPYQGGVWFGGPTYAAQAHSYPS